MYPTLSMRSTNKPRRTWLSHPNWTPHYSDLSLGDGQLQNLANLLMTTWGTFRHLFIDGIMDVMPPPNYKGLTINGYDGTTYLDEYIDICVIEMSLNMIVTSSCVMSFLHRWNGSVNVVHMTFAPLDWFVWHIGAKFGI